MESEPHIVRKRRSKQKKRRFFKRKSKLLKMRYWEISAFLALLIFIIVGLFNRVIYQYFTSF